MPSESMRAQREAALQHVCTYRVPQVSLPASVRRRERKDGSDGLFCGAAVGVPCKDPRTGEPLNRQAAHHPRLVAAGVAAEPRLSGAVA